MTAVFLTVNNSVFSAKLFAMNRLCNHTLLFILLICSFPSNAIDHKPAKEYYQIRIYHFANKQQEQTLDNYFSIAYLPALHKAGFKHIGVFKPIANDTASDKKIYVFIAASSLEKLAGVNGQLQKDSAYKKAASAYLEAAFDLPPFTRTETIFLSSFRLAPKMILPALKSSKAERIYELRSYESATDKLYEQKVKMFNEGGEIALFRRLDFNAIFYADVISGSRMPNLMYMTSFENKAERDAHWKTFGSDPEWKRLSGLAEYAHTVNKADIILMQATEYSDF
jgi:hypothetical protein